MKKLVLFILVGWAYFAYSSEATFTLEGKVFDAETNEPLPGATVQIVEIPKGTFTDVKGRFRLSNVPLQQISIKVSYIGYQASLINIDPKKERELEVPLYPEIKATQEVTVEAVRSRDNETAILNLKKNSSNLADGISLTEIKRMADNSLSSALKRISGVSMYNDFVLVRGTSERYSNATLNGVVLPSTEADKKVFSFDLFPSDFVENVTLVKSFTPDMPGNFAGGIVQLNTVDFPVGTSLKVSIASSQNSNLLFKRNGFLSYPGGKLDWLGIDDGTRKLPDGFPSNRTEFNQLLSLANNPFDTTGAVQKFEKLARAFQNKTLKQQQRTITPFDNRNFALQYATSFDVSDYLIGITANGLFSSENNAQIIQRNTYLSNFDTMYKASGGKYIRSANLGGLLNLSFKTPSSQIYTLKTSIVNNTDDEILTLDGSDLGYQFLEFKTRSMHYTQKTLFTTSLQGNNVIIPLNLKFDWTANYSKLNRYEPDYRRFRFSRSLFNAQYDPTTPFVLELLFNQQGDGTRAGRFFANLDEEKLSFLSNFERTFGSTKVKFGILFDNTRRNFNARSITITASPYLSEDIYQLLSEYDNIDKILDPANFRYEDGLRIGEDSRLSDSYNGDERQIAGYLMIDQRFNLFDISMRFVGGIRFESNLIQLRSHNINDQPVQLDYLTNDFLPSFNLIVMTSKNSNLRASVSRTLARPSFREFAPFAFYDYYELCLVQGNPNLKRALITNIDLRYEIFPSLNELYSVGLFYKSFVDAIEETIFPQQSELTRTFANANGVAKNFGIEVELRKNLGFLWSALQNLSLTTNVTFIHSRVEVDQGGKGTTDVRPMWGQSPYTVNVGLFYQNQTTGTSFSLTYNTYGKRIVRVSQVGVYQTNDPHVYEIPQNFLDLAIIQRIAQFDLKLSARNILNAKTIYEQNGRTWGINRIGTTFSISLSYSIL
jgi:TonB-dependent receptor